ncbi:MAG TPA: HEPN domain-containing protein [Terracidiphilus sp.]|nr:HEPN domain-containing protein [Terracidiphilus sp.]
MSAAQNLQVQTLFIKSAEDEDTLQFEVRDAIFEFHTQQAIEKLLKALIAAHWVEFPFTHNLQLLLDQLTALGETVPAFDPPLFKFTKFGVIVRYDSGVPLTQVDRQQYRKIVEDLRTFVTARVDLLP